MRRLVAAVLIMSCVLLAGSFAISHEGNKYSKPNDDLYVKVRVSPTIVNVLSGVGGFLNMDVSIANQTDDVTFDLGSITGDVILNDGATIPLDFLEGGDLGPGTTLILIPTILLPGDADNGGASVEIDVEFTADDGSSGVAHARDRFTVKVQSL